MFQHSPSYSNDRVQYEIDQLRTYYFNPLYETKKPKEQLHGYTYQLKLLMLFALNGQKSKMRFLLATEMSEANDFDDLVFGYEHEGILKYWFLQAKHTQFLENNNKINFSEFESSDIEKKFSLLKYFISYLDIKKSEEFMNGEIENLIICTNNDFDFDPSLTIHEQAKTKLIKKKWKKYLPRKIKNVENLDFLGGEIHEFNKDPVIRKEINAVLTSIFEKNEHVSKDDVNKIDDFLNKMVFLVSQPSEEKLENKIKEKIGDEFILINDIIYHEFFEFMWKWMSHRVKVGGESKAHYLSHYDIKQLLEESKNKLVRLGFNSMRVLNKKKCQEFGLVFKDNVGAMKEIANYVESQNGILIIETKYEFFSEIMLSQIFQESNKVIFSDLKSLSLLHESESDPVTVFKSEVDNLVITRPSEKRHEILYKFYDVIKENPEKKIILIVHPDQMETIETTLNKYQELKKKINVDDVNLNDLTDESKDKMLEKEITLFGESVTLKSLITDFSVIEGDALMALVDSDNNKIEIGSEYQYDFDYIDIPRTFTYQTQIKKSFLAKIKEDVNDLFVITNVSQDDLSRLVPKKQKKICNYENYVKLEGLEKNNFQFILLDKININKKFYKLSYFANRPVHLLENKGGTLELKRSHFSLQNLRKFVQETVNITKKIEDFAESAIIAGEPGTGKSTVLTSYSKISKSLWNIRIDLKNYETYINQNDFNSRSDIVKFLTTICLPTNSARPLVVFVQKLLEYCLQQSGKVILLLDGYDEIKNRTKKKIVKLLQATLKFTEGNFLITTRLYAMSQLEDALGIFAHRLNPFNKDEQIKFLKTFWIDKFPKQRSVENKIEEFTKKLLEYLYELNLLKKETIVGNALQTRMVGNIFQDACKKFVESKKFDLSNCPIENECDLYDKFIEHQYERYFNEKIDISSNISKGWRSIITKQYTKQYGYLALKSLFPEDEIRDLLSEKSHLDEKLKDIGMITILKSDGTANFLHAIYAEYFVAVFLVDALSKKEYHPMFKAVNDFLLLHIFKRSNEIIRHFIDNIIKKKKGDLMKKWEEMEKCNFLKGFKTIESINFESSESFEDASEEELFKVKVPISKHFWTLVPINKHLNITFHEVC